MVIEAVGIPPTFQAAVEEVAFTGRVRVHRLCERTGDLSDQAVRAKEAGYSRIQEYPARRLSRRDPPS